MFVFEEIHSSVTTASGEKFDTEGYGKLRFRYIVDKNRYQTPRSFPWGIELYVPSLNFHVFSLGTAADHGCRYPGKKQA